MTREFRAGDFPREGDFPRDDERIRGMIPSFGKKEDLRKGMEVTIPGKRSRQSFCCVA